MFLFWLLTIAVAPPYSEGSLPTGIRVEPSSGSCFGGDNGLNNTDIILTCGYRQDSLRRTFTLTFSSNVREDYNLTYGNNGENISNQADYLFEQMEHGGGDCKCARIEFISTSSAGIHWFPICGGSASVPRREQYIWNGTTGELQVPPPTIRHKQPPLQLQCNSEPHIELSFVVLFKEDSDYCNTINEFNEGVEFSYQLLSMPNEWVPIIFLYNQNRTSNPDILIGDIYNFTIRGYRVFDVVNGTINRVTLNICGFDRTDFIRFRWLHTARFSHMGPKDVWILDNITINLVNSKQQSINLLYETFSESTLNLQIWPMDNVRNAQIGQYCNYTEGLIFGLDASLISELIIVSRGIITQFYNLSSMYISSNSSTNNSISVDRIRPTVTSDNSTSTIESTTEVINPSPTNSESELFTIIITNTISEPANEFTSILKSTESILLEPSFSHSLISTTLVNNFMSSSIKSVNTSIIIGGNEMNVSSRPQMDNIDDNVQYLIDLERNTTNKILSIELLSTILNSRSTSSLQILENLTMSSSDVDIITLTYLYVNQVIGIRNASLIDSIAEEAVALGIQLLTQPSISTSRALLVAGTTLLSIQDDLLAATLNSQIFQSFNFVLFRRIIDLNLINSSSITAINSSDFTKLMGPLTTLTIPVVLLRAFDDGDGIVGIISAIYRNVTSLFSYQLDSSSFLGPDIVASSIQCERSTCDTSKYQLQNSSVTITFQHSENIKNMITSKNLETTCVFLDILEINSSIFKMGKWSKRGCLKNYNLSTDSVTVCECNHLTHFGILLSPKPPQVSPAVALSLSIISYVGVAISLVAMSITIITFAALKSLHSMRNYIHVNLCISLALGQILFVAGVDRTGSSPNGGVPIHCQVIAVLLHYFFLVSFMWMLMEGVILYLALVKVFIKNKRYYIITFTCISYGLPILYMGLLSLPLGFGLSRDNYGYDRACFLNASNNFVWAIIVPFLVIFLANLTFFVITARIMWRHQTKQIEKNKYEMIRGWLRSAISLLVIMSLTWIIGILVLEVEALIPLAYIYTIMVALQGFFIFLIFVVFSNPVREAYAKWWKSKINQSDWLQKRFQQQIDSSSNGRSSHGINLETKKTPKPSSSSSPVKVTIMVNRATREDNASGTNFNEYFLSTPQTSSLATSNLSLSTSFNSCDTQTNLFADYAKCNDK